MNLNNLKYARLSFYVFYWCTAMKLTMIVTGIVILLILAYFIVNAFIMKNVKTPDYTVLEKTNSIELRQYQPMLIAEVTVSGDRDTAASRGFKLLADFIFGNNQASHQKSEKISMTAPVLQKRNQKIAMTAPVMQTETTADTWQVQFVMPKQYTLESLPKPNNKAVTIKTVPARKMLVIRFSGTSTMSNLKKHQALLMQYIEQHKIKTNGEFEYAFYNPPWTLPFMRRNEVMIKIK